MKTDQRRFPACELAEWYNASKRDLPWRSTSDPFAIWISEVILQQTRVDQGTPYYHRFLEAFPTVQHLAAASEDEVLKLWEGLGYYSRARNLHAAAKQVVANFNGQFPDSYEALRSLKGIGPYTAAAVGSIAFGLPVACVDGNVTRVLARFHGITSPVDENSTIKAIHAMAQEALDTSAPSTHNQAMMELGATVCVPKGAKCGACPLQNRCAALRMDIVEEIPVKGKKVKVRERCFNYLAITDGRQTLIKRREEGDIWQGLYEFPMVESDRPMQPDAVLSILGVEGHIIVTGHHGPVKHVLTHQRILATCTVAEVAHLPDLGMAIETNSLPNFALPRLLHRFDLKKLFGEKEKV